MVLSFRKKIILAIVCMVEITLFCGIQYGFNSLIGTFRLLGVFSQYCNTSAPNKKNENKRYLTCTKQDIYFASAFVCWSVFQAAISVPTGITFDYLGIKFMKVLNGLCIATGLLLFGIVQFNSWLLFPAGCFAAFTSMSLGMCNVALADVYGKRKNLMVSIFSGLVNASALVFSIIKIFYDIGIPLYVSFSTLAGLALLIIIPGALILIENTNDTSPILRFESSYQHSEFAEMYVDLIDLKEEYLREIYPNIWKTILCRKYILNVLFFAIMFYRYTFFLAQLSSQLKFLFSPNEELIENLQFRTNYFFASGVFVSIFVGFLIDHSQKVSYSVITNLLSEEPSGNHFKIFDRTFIAPFLICNAVAVLASSLVGIANKYIYYIIFLLLSTCRSFNTSLLGSYIRSVFPKQYFGTLLGTTFLFAGLFNLTQFIFIDLGTPDKYPMLINYFMIGITLLALSHPINLYVSEN